MKKTIALIEKLQENLEYLIQKREEKYDNASESWQDSEKGDAFNEKTERLQEILDEVSEWQIELEEE